MTDRQIVYAGSIPQDTDLLNQNKNTMIGLGMAMQAVLGTSTYVDGLACAPTSPASMTVNVAPGSIYSLQNVDGTAYGSLSADTTHQIVKQGIVLDTTNLSCPAPATSGYSINYLIQVAYQDVDSGSTVLPYYNSSNPSVAYNGPNNTGVSQNTVRKAVCVVGVKAGVAATTGTQVTPSPDAGYTGLWVVTVANGASTITSGNISQLSTAPFISPKLPNFIPTVQSGTYNYAVDTSGSANTITVALSPVPASIPDGFPITVKVANTPTGAVVMNLNGTGNVAVYDTNGNQLGANSLAANFTYDFKKNGSHWDFHGVAANASTRETLKANRTYYVRTDGSDSNTGLSNTSGGAFLTIQKAASVVGTLDLNGYTVTIQVADGTYSAGVIFSGLTILGGGTIILQGNTTTPANCIISTTSVDCVLVTHGADIQIAGFKLVNATSGSSLKASYGGRISMTGAMEFGASSTYQIFVGDSGSEIIISTNYKITGSAVAHFAGWLNGEIAFITTPTITLTGTPAFSIGFAYITQAANLNALGITFSGSATGPRYSITTNGVVNTNGGGASYFPGNSAGSATTGGQYV